MKIFLEPSGLQFKNNSLTKAIETKEFGIKMSFASDDLILQNEVILTMEEVLDLGNRFIKAIEEINKLKGALKEKEDQIKE